MKPKSKNNQGYQKIVAKNQEKIGLRFSCSGYLRVREYKNRMSIKSKCKVIFSSSK